MRQSRIRVIRLYAYQHFFVCSLTFNSRVIFIIHYFYSADECFSSGISFSLPKVERMKRSSLDSLSRYLLGSSRFSFKNYASFTPWLNVVTKMALISISIFGEAVVILVDSAALKAETGLLILIPDCGFTISSSSSLKFLSPWPLFNLFVLSPVSLSCVFFLFQSIFLMRCCTRVLLSISSIIAINKFKQNINYSCFFQQFIILFCASQHFRCMLFFQSQLLLLFSKLFDLTVKILHMFFVDLSLLKHSLLEAQSLFDQPIVFLFGFLSLLAPHSLLVFFLYRHLIVLFGGTHLLQLNLNKNISTFFFLRTFSLSMFLRSRMAWAMSCLRWDCDCLNSYTSFAFFLVQNSFFCQSQSLSISWNFLQFLVSLRSVERSSDLMQRLSSFYYFLCLKEMRFETSVSFSSSYCLLLRRLTSLMDSSSEGRKSCWVSRESLRCRLLPRLCINKIKQLCTYHHIAVVFINPLFVCLSEKTIIYIFVVSYNTSCDLFIILQIST